MFSVRIVFIFFSLNSTANQSAVATDCSNFYPHNEIHIQNGQEEEKEEKDVFTSSNQPVSF